MPKIYRRSNTSNQSQTSQLLFEKATLIRDAVFSANDGIITTFAVVSGSQGANLDTKIVITLGLANLFADAFSMAAGSYLGSRSELDVMNSNSKRTKYKLDLIKNSLATFFSFAIAGSIPLIPYLAPINSSDKYLMSLLFVALSLVLLGFLRSLLSTGNKVRIVLETFLLGSTAAGMAYAIGVFTRQF